MNELIGQAAARRITEEAAQWLLANREGLDASSRAAFMAWLRHSPAHVAEYMAIVQWEQEVREAAPSNATPAHELIERAAREPAVVPLRTRAPAPSLHASSQPARASHRSRRLVGAAAACAAMAVAVATYTLAPSRPATPPGVVYSAPADATRSLQLDDGSRIQLDRGTSIRVQFDNRQRAIAVLGGTMLIDVGHDSPAPLSVTLGRTVLRDIGTVFQVSARANGGDVAVLSGRVDVMADEHVVAHLEGGERASMAGDGSLSHIASRTDFSQDLAWLPADIDFHDAPVSEVARRFNDYGQAPLLIEDEAVANTRISGRFHARDPAGFVAYLQTLPDVRIHRDAQGIHVVRGNTPARLRRL
jgi:transmembrane sensor